MGWIMDSHSPGAAYHLWYLPISLCTDISSIRKCVYPPIGRQKGIAGHQRGALPPLGPTIYPQEAGSERWVYLIFHPSVVLIRKYFSIHTFTYLSTSHLTRQTPVPSYPHVAPHYPTFPTALPPFLINFYNVTRRSLSRPHCPRNNTGKFFACIYNVRWPSKRPFVISLIDK